MSHSDRAYDMMILNTDVCPDCGVRYWFGDPCECEERCGNCDVLLEESNTSVASKAEGLCHACECDS